MRRLLVSTVAAVAVMTGSPVLAQVPAPTPAVASATSEDARLAAFFEEAFQQRIALSPQQMTALGLKIDYDKLDDGTDAAAERALLLAESQVGFTGSLQDMFAFLKTDSRFQYPNTPEGKEMGFYQDPYSDFGRLSTELWRAVRLVTDTGLHSRRWSRERAIEYFRQNSLLSERDIVKEVERYITNPGQATSYKIGELRIMELRARAQAALGDWFDIRAFHAVVLGSGALPLDLLEEQVDTWIAAGGGAPAA